MAKCLYCKTNNIYGAKYCKSCKSHLIPLNESKACPSCKSPVGPYAEKCNACGLKISKKWYAQQNKQWTLKDTTKTIIIITAFVLLVLIITSIIE